MKTLAVDTALGACSVAVLEDGRTRARRFALMARGHAEAIAPMVEDAMREAGIEFLQLDRLAVTTGPGTFTGQRVGLAFMRGLRVALRKPLIGVTTLEAMGVQAMKEMFTARAAVAHDARRDEIYLQLIDASDPAVMKFADALAACKDFACRGRSQSEGLVALAGTAGPRLAAELEPGSFTLSEVCQPDALWVARLAEQRTSADTPPAPLYLRPPDAKLPIIKLSGLRRFDLARDDPAALASLHAAAFDESWSADAIGTLLAGPGVFALIAPAGFVLARVAAGEAEIRPLCVAPHARRQGLGRALLAAAAAAAEARGAATLFLEVSAANSAARGLYAGAGFAEIGTRKAYYGTDNLGGGDALALKARLPLSPSSNFA